MPKDLTQVSARLSEETVAWLDAMVAGYKKRNPGHRFTRSDALRSVLEHTRLGELHK